MAGYFFGNKKPALSSYTLKLLIHLLQPFQPLRYFMDSHFETLNDYDSEIPEHIRKYLLEKKLALQLRYIDARYSSRNLKVLDAGCGTGWHMKRMMEHGFDVSGVDSSDRQCANAKKNTASSNISVNSVLSLPFENKSFDIVYTINTLHHLKDLEQQKAAMLEIERVLKPNGMLFIHEINVLNPIARIYMDYVFPKLKGIDDGTEQWLNAKIIESICRDLTVTNTDYYTFIPDFLPKCLMKPALAVERVLEKSILRKYSGHFTCVCQKK